MPTAQRPRRTGGDPLRDTTVVLTGATSGIGRATALDIAGQPAHLLLHGPQPESDVADLLDGVAARMRAGSRLTYLRADYGDLAGVAPLAEAVRSATDRIHVLINNAARPAPQTRTVGSAGTEVTFQTNYLAAVLLTTRLLEVIGVDGRGRIVNVASATHLSARLRLDDLTLAQGSYAPSTAYAHSKLALVTYSCWLAAHRPRPTVDVVSVHPGVVATGLLHAMFSVTGDRPEQAAATLRHVASQRDDNGVYYDERTPASPNPQAADPQIQAELHDLTARLLDGHT